MMSKKKAMLTGLMLAVVSMMAYAAERGVSVGKSLGLDSDRTTACVAAKKDAAWQVPFGAAVTSYGSCDCSKDKHYERWVCSVEAYWERK